MNLRVTFGSNGITYVCLNKSRTEPLGPSAKIERDKTMFKETVFGIAAASIMTISAFSTSAQAGNFYFEAPQPEFHIQFGHSGDNYAQRDYDHDANPCHYLKRKYRNTGNYRWKREYNRCMRANF